MVLSILELSETEKQNYEKALKTIHCSPEFNRLVRTDARGFSPDTGLGNDYCCSHVILASSRQLEAEIIGNGFSFMPALMEKIRKERETAFSAILNAGNALYSKIKIEKKELSEDTAEGDEGLYAILEFEPVCPIDDALQAIKKVQKLRTDHRMLAGDQAELKKLLEEIAELNEKYGDLNRLDIDNPLKIEMKLGDFSYKADTHDSYFLTGSKNNQPSRVRITFDKMDKKERNLDSVLSTLLDYKLAYSSEELIKSEIKRCQDKTLIKLGYEPEKMNSVEYYTELGKQEVVEKMPEEWFELKNPKKAPADIKLNIIDSDNPFVKEIIARLREKEEPVQIDYT